MESDLPEWEAVLSKVLIFVLVAIFLRALFVDAHARSEPWCAPTSATLLFPDQKGRDAVRVDLRSPMQTCTVYETDQAVGLYREPAMRVESYGKSVAVPPSCLADLAFRLSDITVSTEENAVGIKISARLVDRNIKMLAVVRISDSEVHCSQTVH